MNTTTRTRPAAPRTATTRKPAHRHEWVDALFDAGLVTFDEHGIPTLHGAARLGGR